MRSLEALNVWKYARTRVNSKFILVPSSMWNTAKCFLLTDISIRRVIGIAWRHKEVIGAVHMNVCTLFMYLYNTIHEIYTQSIQVLIHLYWSILFITSTGYQLTLTSNGIRWCHAYARTLRAPLMFYKTQYTYNFSKLLSYKQFHKDLPFIPPLDCQLSMTPWMDRAVDIHVCIYCVY